MSIRADLGVGLSVLAAPMAGGPTTPGLVVAAARAGSLGFLAAGYKTADQLAAQVAEVRSAGVAFGVNLFVPAPVPVDPVAYAAYAEELVEVAAAHGTDPRTVALREDDDDWDAKVAHLLDARVPLVSFTFGIPDPALVAELGGRGTRTLQTVTSLDEATAAVRAGVDGLVVQAASAGGHSGTLTPEVLPAEVPLDVLVASIAASTGRPVWAAGGVGTREQAAAALAAGADAVLVGTVLLRTLEAGTSAPYRAALADGSRTETLLTRAFSGRPARALRNGFVDRFHHRAPAGYPAVHHLTSPLRRAAAAAGDPECINLWAGTGWRHAREEPVGEVLQRLSGR